MAWAELDASGNYFICLRVGEKRFKRSLKTSDQEAADGAVSRVKENLRHVENGVIAIPPNADPISFLLSNGKVTGPLCQYE